MEPSTGVFTVRSTDLLVVYSWCLCSSWSFNILLKTVSCSMCHFCGEKSQFLLDMKICLWLKSWRIPGLVIPLQPHSNGMFWVLLLPTQSRPQASNFHKLPPWSTFPPEVQNCQKRKNKRKQWWVIVAWQSENMEILIKILKTEAWDAHTPASSEKYQLSTRLRPACTARHF